MIKIKEKPYMNCNAFPIRYKSKYGNIPGGLFRMGYISPVKNDWNNE